MSYCRWSTDIKNVVPWEEMIELSKEGEGWYDKYKTLQKERGAELSKWYIFWHCGYRDDAQQEEVREDQLLAIYLASGPIPVLDYETVKDMYDTDDWSAYFDEVPQKEFMRECVKEWLDDVSTLRSRDD